MKSYNIKNLKNNLKKCQILDTPIEQRIKKKHWQHPQEQLGLRKQTLSEYILLFLTTRSLNNPSVHIIKLFVECLQKTKSTVTLN